MGKSIQTKKIRGCLGLGLGIGGEWKVTTNDYESVPQLDCDDSCRTL